MPCTDGGCWNDGSQEKIDNLTQKLCELCGLVDDNILPDHIKSWWREHQEKDKVREVKEAITKSNQFLDKIRKILSLEGEPSQSLSENWMFALNDAKNKIAKLSLNKQSMIANSLETKV